MNDKPEPDPRLYAIPDIHGHAKGEHKAYIDERPIPLSARMLFLWFYHACRRGWPRFLMVSDHMNYLTFEDPAAINLVRRALKLAQAGDLYGAAETASVEVGHAAVVSEGLRRGMRYSLGAEIDNDPRSRPDAQNIVDAMKPDGMIRSIHFLTIDHPTHGPNWSWPFDNPEFADVYETVGTAKTWEVYMSTLLDAIERLPGNIVGHFYVPAVFGHWPDDATLEAYEDQVVGACETRGMALEFNTRFLYRAHSTEERDKYLTANRRLLRKCKEKNVGIAVGSDAHSPKDQGAAFAQALALLDECEINELVFPIAGRLARVALRVERKGEPAAEPAAPGDDGKAAARRARTIDDAAPAPVEAAAEPAHAPHGETPTPAKAKPRPKRAKVRVDPEPVLLAADDAVRNAPSSELVAGAQLVPPVATAEAGAGDPENAAAASGEVLATSDWATVIAAEHDESSASANGVRSGAGAASPPHDGAAGQESAGDIRGVAQAALGLEPTAHRTGEAAAPAAVNGSQLESQDQTDSTTAANAVSGSNSEKPDNTAGSAGEAARTEPYVATLATVSAEPQPALTDADSAPATDMPGGAGGAPATSSADFTGEILANGADGSTATAALQMPANEAISSVSENHVAERALGAAELQATSAEPAASFAEDTNLEVADGDNADLDDAKLDDAKLDHADGGDAAGLVVKASAQTANGSQIRATDTDITPGDTLTGGGLDSGVQADAAGVAGAPVIDAAALERAAEIASELTVASGDADAATDTGANPAGERAEVAGGNERLAVVSTTDADADAAAAETQPPLDSLGNVPSLRTALPQTAKARRALDETPGARHRASRPAASNAATAAPPSAPRSSTSSPSGSTRDKKPERKAAALRTAATPKAPKAKPSAAKTSLKKTAAKKTVAKKSAVKKAAPKRAPARKPAAKKAAVRAGAKKATAKKSVAKKSAPKKPAQRRR